MRPLPTLALFSLMAAACVGFDTTQCADGRVCESGSVCDDAHASCALPEQLEQCREEDDGVQCFAVGSFGVCDAGVCLLDECGNGVLEASETCDLEPVDTCVDQGFAFGRMQCSDQCTLAAQLCGTIGFQTRRPSGFFGTVMSDVFQDEGGLFVAIRGGFFNAGFIGRFDGTDWEYFESTPYVPMNGGAPRSKAIEDMDGPSSNDLFAVGSVGFVAHYDGEAWQELDAGVGQGNLFTVSVSADEVFIGGDSGAWILDRSSGQWQAQVLPDLQTRSIIASTFWRGEPYALAVLPGGSPSSTMVFRRSGGNWTQTIEPDFLVDIASSESELFAVGSVVGGSGIVRRSSSADLSDFAEESIPGADGAHFLTVETAVNDQLFIGSESGLVHHYRDGWAAYRVGDAPVDAVRPRASGFVAASVGLVYSSGRAMRANSATTEASGVISALDREHVVTIREGRAWLGSFEEQIELTQPANIRATDARYMSDGRVYLTGHTLPSMPNANDESPWVAVLDSNAANPILTELSGFPVATAAPTRLAVTSAHEVWTADTRRVWRYRQGAWEDMLLPPAALDDGVIGALSVTDDQAFIVIAPNVFEPSSSRTTFEIYRWAAGEWQSFLAVPDGEVVQDVEAVGDYVFVTGAQLRVWNGVDWRVDSIPFVDAGFANRVSAHSTDDAIATSLYGELMHFDGVAWSPIESETNIAPNILLTENDLFVASSVGLQLLHRFDSWTSP